MSSLLRTILSAAVVAAASLSPVAAFADTSLGVYQTTDRKMDYDLRLCGSGNTQLCVMLKDARGTALTKETEKFIGKDIVHNATPAGNNVWKGSVSIAGRTLDGTLILNAGTNFVMHGCLYFVVCSDFTLIPSK